MITKKRAKEILIEFGAPTLLEVEEIFYFFQLGLWAKEHGIPTLGIIALDPVNMLGPLAKEAIAALPKDEK